MNLRLVRIGIFITVLALAVFLSCKKEEDQMIPPKLEFKTGGNYTSRDTSVAVGSSVLVGIEAEQAEEGDFLNTFSVTHSFDGGAEVTDSTIILDETQHESFQTDITISTRTQAGLEKYMFTITNRDGLITSKSIVITVK